jgi:two-component system sensor histidine kinase UhpB
VQQRLLNLPIFIKITVGNSLVILVGAIGGTLITRRFASQAADLWLILSYLLVGVLMSILVNYWIVRAALRPLDDLYQFVDHLQTGQAQVEQLSRPYDDPELSQLAAVLESLITELEASNQQLRMTTLRAINAQEDERKRIARSLHDDTGQALSTLIISLERLEQHLPLGEDELRQRLETARQLAAGILVELRKIVHGLRPAILDDLGLMPAIRWYARSNLEEAGIQVDVNMPEERLDLPPELKTTLFRIAQEAINNIQRHSQAHKATISIEKNKDHIHLCVEDDGQGFDVPHSQGEAIRHRQWGLVNIQERAELVGGDVDFVSEPGKGTRLQVFVPLSRGKETRHG